MTTEPTPQPGVSRRQLLTAGGAAVAAGALGSTVLGRAAAGAAPTSPVPVGPAVTAAADVATGGTPFPHVWERAIGGDHAQQVLRRDYQDQLFQCHRELGVQSLRFHGILNDGLSTYLSSYPSGYVQGKYSWFNIDQIYGALVDNGMYPLVELSDMPKVLAANPADTFFFKYPFNPSAPADFKAWGGFIKDFTQHMVDFFGLPEVQKWPFEVWNEPNLPFYDGDQQSYYNLYRSAAEGIKAVDSSIRVGGPAVSAGQINIGPPKDAGPVFYRKFMNFVTNNNVPIDFGSSHGYETDDKVGPEGPASFFKTEKALTPAGVPLYVTETNITSGSSNAINDDPDAAASFLKTIVNTVGVVDLLSFWTFSDIFEESGQATNPFHGGFGLLTIQGIKKPTYRLFEILHGVGDVQVPLTLKHAPASVGGIAVTGGNRRSADVLLYNHSVPSGKTGVPATPAETATVTVSVAGLGPNVRGKLRLIDADHANAKAEWIALGSPQFPTKQQLNAIDNASALVSQSITVSYNAHTNATMFTITLPAESVAAINLG